MFYQYKVGAGGWIFMALGNVVIWGLLIVWLAQDLRLRPHRHHIASGASAAEILDRRLATGELNADEYTRLRSTLAPAPSGQPARIRETTGAPR